MDEIDTDERLDPGGLWRAVLNFLGGREPTPALYLPLLDAVLPKWGRWTYFLGCAAEKIGNDRAELEADAARARLGWRLWTEQREELRTFAERSAKRAVTDQELENWWITDTRGEWRSWGGAYERGPEFARLTHLTAEDIAVILHHPDMPKMKLARWTVEWIRWDLGWAADLGALRTLARKTWTPEPRGRPPWTTDDVDFVNAYFEEQAPAVYALGSPERVDPFELAVVNDEQSLGIGLDGLRYCMYVLLRSTVIDFADEILERSRRPSARGSLWCIECGRFVGRRALGYGQLYCCDRCKKRAAKRRYRHRNRDAVAAA